MVLRQPLNRWIAAAGSLAILLLLTLIAISAYFVHGAMRDPGWSAAATKSGLVVKRADSHQIGTALHAGDRLLAVDGDFSAAEYGPLLPLAKVAAGSTYEITTERDGKRQNVRLLMTTNKLTGGYEILLSLAIVALLYAMGMCISLLGRDDLTSRLAAASFFLGALEMGRPILLVFPGWSASTATLAIFTTTFWQPFHLAVGYDFLSRFPAPVAEGVPTRLLRKIFYLIAAVFWFSLNATLLLEALHVAASPVLDVLLALRPGSYYGSLVMSAFEASSGAAMCLVLVRNYIRLPDAGARRRLRWAGLGLACSVFPFLIVALVRFSVRVGGGAWQARFLDAMTIFEPLLVALAPILLAYAVTKHHVLGITVVVRRGIQYLFAKNVLRLIVAAPFAAVAFEILRHPDRPLQQIFIHVSWRFYLLVAISAAVGLIYRNQISVWIDRKFFRQAYGEEAVLMAIVERLQSSDSMDEVSSIVAQELEATFHPTKLFILYRKQSAGLLTVGYPPDSPGALQVRGYLNEKIRETALLDRSSRTPSELGVVLTTASSSSIADLKDVLAIPVTSTDGSLAAVLYLGEKRSEQSYSERDRKLLEGVAVQIARAYEVLKLKETIREEQKVRVEVLGRLDQQQFQLLYECPACGRCYDSPLTHCERDGAVLGLTLPVERIIDGKYRLDQRIGSGGMGAVYEAYDLRLSRTVAIKILTGRLFGNQAALRRFEREARTSAKLNHPNIISIYDFGALRGGGAYLVMQLMAGKSWRAELDTARQTVPAHVAGWFDQLCDGMACAHASGVIHRDLKPENVILSGLGTGDEKVTLLDFGLAKIRAESPSSDSNLTTEGMVLGTYGYMSPEQRAGELVDVRTDIYATAVLVVETLSGTRPPVTGASTQWMYGSLRWPAPNFATKQLLALLECCLSNDPGARIDQMERLHRYLIPLLRDSPPAIWAQSAGGSDETIIK